MATKLVCVFLPSREMTLNEALPGDWNRFLVGINFDISKMSWSTSRLKSRFHIWTKKKTLKLPNFFKFEIPSKTRFRSHESASFTDISRHSSNIPVIRVSAKRTSPRENLISTRHKIGLGSLIPNWCTKNLYDVIRVRGSSFSAGKSAFSPILNPSPYYWYEFIFQ